MDQLNGFELAGRPMKVGNVTDHSADNSGGSYYDIDDMDRAGFGLGATGRIQLMAKLAEGERNIDVIGLLLLSTQIILRCLS
jgi:RNA-binding protein 23/39